MRPSTTRSKRRAAKTTTLRKGEWAHERKVADWKQVIKLAGEALATKSKDLQLAAWLTEAMLRTEGFGGLLASLRLCQGLIENFWDTLYPELEDGEAEMRAAPLDWIGSRLDQAVRMAPLTRKGYDWFQFKQSRAVGYEADAADNEVKQQARAQAIAEGKVTGEDFDWRLQRHTEGVLRRVQAEPGR